MVSRVAQFDKHILATNGASAPHLAAWDRTILPVRPNLDTISVLAPAFLSV